MSTRDATHDLLKEAWAALRGPPAALELVSMTGEPIGLLPSRLAALPAMLAAVAASTLAASLLDAARRGTESAPVLIDIEDVALAARSERYARTAGNAESDLFAPLSRFWRTSDGWLRLHANYPWHRARALTVLDSDGDPERVEQAILGWRGEELEDALAGAGALGYAVRSASEWAAHPQGRALANAPMLEIGPGDGTGRGLGAGRGASGWRVLDLTRVIAGPVATRTLAAWGAEVLRLDSPSLPELPSQSLDMLSGKQSALLDFSERSGRRQLEALLSRADVLVAGYRPGALDRYGLGADALAQRHSHLSVLSISAWGSRGLWGTRRGFDSLVQCPTGIAAVEGSDERPGVLPAQVLDHATGYLTAAAALLALAGVQQGKPPLHATLSLAQTARWLMSGGAGDPEPERVINAEDHLVSLTGAGAPVRVIGPPGRAGDLAPAWSSTTEFGADPPTFRR